MKELHARVEAGLAQAKAVLENPNSSQEEVDAQVQVMKDLTEEVNKVLAGGLTSPAQLGDGSGATPSEPSSTPKRGRRGRGQLTPPAENQETKERTEEVTDYTNGQGSYPLSEKIHNLLQELKASAENPEHVQKLKEAYDKLNEALGRSENGLVNQEVFNAALEEYKKATQLKKGSEGTGRTRNRRSVSGLVYGFATGSDRNEKRARDSSGRERDSRSLFNGQNLNTLPLKYIATVETGTIRDISLSGFPTVDKNGKTWATITKRIDNNGKRAVIAITGRSPKDIHGVYNTTLTVIEGNGHVSSKIQAVQYQLPKPEFDESPLHPGKTAQEDVEGKAGEKPIIKGKIPTPPGGLSASNIPKGSQLRMYLVQGGHNDSFDGIETSAKGYDIVAWGLVGADGTSVLYPTQYKKQSIGDKPLRLIVAYVHQGTDRLISEDLVSPLSKDSITPTHPIDRDGAIGELDTAAGNKKTAIEKTPNLTAEEIADAKGKVDQALADAKRKVGEAKDQAGVNRAKQEGLQALQAINPTPTTHNKAIGELDTAAGNKKTAIEKTPNLTAEEIADAKGKVDQALADAKRKVGEAKDQAGVNRAKQEGLQALQAINPTPTTHNKAIGELDTAAGNKKTAIEKTPNLTAEEIADAKGKVDQALADAKRKVGEAKDQAGVNRAKQEGLQALQAINPTPTTHNKAIGELDTAAGNKKTAIEKTPNLTAEEIADAKGKVDQALADAKRKVGEAKDQAGVNRAKQEGLQALQAINPTAKANSDAKSTLTQKATDKKKDINNIPHLTDEEKNAAIKKVDEALEKAKKAIDAATNQAEIDAAKRTLETELDQISREAEAKSTLTQKATDKKKDINNIPHLTDEEKNAAIKKVDEALEKAKKAIDAATNQAEIDAAKRTLETELDQISREAEALGRANARTLSSQDKDQTPPRRARRSVGIVGNSQTGTTPSAVDKSELRTLIEDLERRLQNLAGLSPEALEEAQRILREAQAALANENLTAQELADLLAKVRQSLNSLQAGTSADKSQSASSSNKEVGSAKESKSAIEVPLYGVFGAAVLSLLGALLFAVARKKSSQLDKLSRELNQLVVELEASNKDKKVLNKAKKLADEARLFVDSQQKDSQKEAELISEIKTVLSQLKEEI
ncbi:DUF1542 domain-containing protein [Streptococcus sp. Marseille-Q5986]|uniref:DUF1542 domain-containing protein n=1 Tax=Streptococcus sp. Marseille-Q5986 TaxID=2972782 RepID=UPI0022654D85|nr:DUF1542 domain-containing protein [Streptococcus sp. Marseille-Q5986]